MSSGKSSNQMSQSKFVLLLALASIATVARGEFNVNEIDFEPIHTDKSLETFNNVAQPNQFPWHAHIFALVRQNKWVFGGGALITSRHVVTAANLIDGSQQTRILFGAVLGQGQQYFPQRTILHPRYPRRDGDSFNIAVLQLEQPVRLTNVRPIAFAHLTANTRLEGQHVRVSGFIPRSSNQPNRVNRRLLWNGFRLQNMQNCRETIPANDSNFFLCSSDFISSFFPIGSPVVWRPHNSLQLIGLTVIGPNSGRSGHLNVARHAEWLRQVTRS